MDIAVQHWPSVETGNAQGEYSPRGDANIAQCPERIRLEVATFFAQSKETPGPGSMPMLTDTKKSARVGGAVVWLRKAKE